MTLIILSSKGHAKPEDFSVYLNAHPRIKRLALQSFSMTLPWNNVSANYKNSKFSFYDGLSWTDITIPDGNYTLEELNHFLANYFGTDDPPIIFGDTAPRQKVSISMKPGYKIDLTKSKICEMLGFEPKIYDKSHQEGKYRANMSKVVDEIQIHCDKIEGAKLNECSSDVIYSFTPTDPPGTLISKEFDKPVFFRVFTSIVSEIQMYVTNGEGERLDLNNQKVIYRLLAEM